MFVEASKMAGTGELTLTGQLGDVMKESAQIALNWIRANAPTVSMTKIQLFERERERERERDRKRENRPQNILLLG